MEIGLRCSKSSQKDRAGVLRWLAVTEVKCPQRWSVVVISPRSLGIMLYEFPAVTSDNWILGWWRFTRAVPDKWHGKSWSIGLSVIQIGVQNCAWLRILYCNIVTTSEHHQRHVLHRKNQPLTKAHRRRLRQSASMSTTNVSWYILHTTNETVVYARIRPWGFQRVLRQCDILCT